jgi:PhnB protein
MPVPYLIVRSAAEAIAFYARVFGATELVRLEAPDGKIAHAELDLAGERIMLADEYPDQGYASPERLGGSPVSLHLTVADADADAVMALALAAGARERMAVADQFDGERRGTLSDPFGHVWLIATPRERVAYHEMKQRFEQLIASGGNA